MEQWQLDALNYEAKAIETFLGIKFEGETFEEKQAFVAAHKGKRLEVTSEMLKEAYESQIGNPAKNMKVYAMNEENHVLHFSWEEALAYYTVLVGQDTFDEQKDDSTGDEIEPSQLTVAIENAASEIKGTVEELIERGVITGVDYFVMKR